jgi:hypothetical protein
MSIAASTLPPIRVDDERRRSSPTSRTTPLHHIPMEVGPVRPAV